MTKNKHDKDPNPPVADRPDDGTDPDQAFQNLEDDPTAAADALEQGELRSDETANAPMSMTDLPAGSSMAGAGALGTSTTSATLRTDGPTFEDFVAAGYAPEDYPPPGFAVKESTGYAEYLTATGQQRPDRPEGEQPVDTGGVSRRVLEGRD